MQNSLIINGHELYPFAQGALNRTFVEQARTTLTDLGHEVRLIEVDKGYEPEKVVEEYFWANNIIYQTPVYWFSIPGAFKKFIDAVFNQGLLRFIDIEDKTKEYGSVGQLTDKKYMLSTTWNSPAEIFNNPEAFLIQNKSVDDVFLPFHMSNRYIGMTKLPTFATQDIYHNPTIEEDLEKFKVHLETYFK